MSSNDDNTLINDTGDANPQRRPGVETESKVLNIVKKNAQEKQQLAASAQAGSGPIQPSLEKESILTLPVIATSNLSVNAAEFIPMAQMKNISGGDENETQSYPLQQEFNNLSLEDGTILSRFNNALYTLNYSPGNMEEYLRPICNTIKSSDKTQTDSEQVMKDMVEALFDQSIQEPNFRYTGARICQYLSTNLRDNVYFGNFHKVLMRRCQQDYNKRDDLLNGTENDQLRLRGLAMFMAEIYLNVEIESANGSKSRLEYLPIALIDFIHTLLSHPLEPEIKCCCMMLKLSGALIEDQAKLVPDLCIKFEEIFNLLGHLKTRDELSNNTKILVGTVIALKEKSWNRNSSSNTNHSFNQDSEGPPFQQEPVFYNTMGAPVSRGQANLHVEADTLQAEDGAYILTEEEEEAFNAWQQEEGLVQEDDSFALEEAEAVLEAGMMGDDVYAAYEEFLQQQDDYRPSGSHHHTNHTMGPNQFSQYPGYHGPMVGNPYVYNNPNQNYPSYNSQGGGFAPLPPQQFQNQSYQHMHQQQHHQNHQQQHHQNHQQQHSLQYRNPNQMSASQQQHQQQPPYSNSYYQQHHPQNKPS